MSYDDNFFELGGTSLTASRVIMQLLAKGYDIEYQQIFEYPTPEGLAEYIEKKKRKTEEDTKEASSGTTGYESEFPDVLQNNTLSQAGHVARKPLGNVLLTGGVGFLGIHVLKELLDANEGKIWCMVRGRGPTTPEKRLMSMLMYYFGQIFKESIEERVELIDADITDPDLAGKLQDRQIDTIINCAAIVKHFAADDSIEHVNSYGVENLISCAKQIHARLIQISTGSIPGVHTEETYRQHVVMHESELFLIDSLDNKYLLSKYHAEQKMFQAIREGLDGKVIRVGNLMGRYSDGEFQVNMNTNAFLSALRGFAVIGKFPLGHATDIVSLSPIDLTARAIVLLAGTDQKFTAFHADNRNSFDEMQIIDACNRSHITIEPVDDEVFQDAYQEFLANKEKNGSISGLITTERPDQHMVAIDNAFTANILYRLGFQWPLPDTSYLDKVIQALYTMDFFN